MTYIITLPCVDLLDKACIEECPVDCIYPDPEWSPGPGEWWELPLSKLDPYK